MNIIHLTDDSARAIVSSGKIMYIGIDLGTTNSLIGVWQNGEVQLIPNSHGQLLTPSAVSIDDDQQIIVGEAALNRLITHPLQTASEFKRSMGSDKKYNLRNQLFSATDLSALILKSLKQDAEHHLNEKIEDVVISVPAYFNDKQRRATQQAAALAGLHCTRLINEPTAAALAYGLQNKNQQSNKHIVLDLGGGTFDVSILEIFDGVVEICATAGDNYFGGLDFTKKIFDYFLTQFELTAEDLDLNTRQKLLKQCESLKKQLSENEHAQFTIQIGDRSHTCTLNRPQFDILNQSLWEKLRQPIFRAINDAELKPEDLAGVIMVGGSSRLYGLRSLIAKIFGVLPLTQYHPDHAIAIGAAVQAMLKSKDRPVKDLVMTDVCPYTLGVQVYNHRNQLVFLPVIERNTTIPVSVTKNIFTMYPNQEGVLIQVYQGESLRPDHNVFLGSLKIELSPSNATQEMLLTYTYDINGALEVEVTLIATGEKRQLILQNNESRIDEIKLKERFKELASLKILPRERQDNILLLATLERLYEEAILHTRPLIAEMVSELKYFLDQHDSVTIETLKKKIHLQLKEMRLQ